MLRNDKQRATTLVTGNQTEEERKQAAAELLSRVSHVQADSRASVVRSLQLVDTSERVAKDTALLVKAQTEQLKDIHADAQSLEAHKLKHKVSTRLAFVRNSSLRALHIALSR